jgi:23S rRNA (adenine-N6)-dimethyltransferase
VYKKALGQHFFVNKTFLERLVELTNVNKSDIVLEIGTGKGTLTTILQKKVGYVVSIEVDSTWFNIAKNIVPKENVTILNTNILFKRV